MAPAGEGAAHPARPNSAVEPSYEPLTSSGPPEPLAASRRAGAASAKTGPACGRSTSSSSPRRGSYRGTGELATRQVVLGSNEDELWRCLATVDCPKTIPLDCWNGSASVALVGGDGVNDVSNIQSATKPFSMSMLC